MASIFDSMPDFGSFNNARYGGPTPSITTNPNWNTPTPMGNPISYSDLENATQNYTLSNGSPQSATNGGPSSSPISDWLDSFKTGWNSVEDNPITRNLLQPVGKAFSAASNMFAGMAPGEATPFTSWNDLFNSLNPLNPVTRGTQAITEEWNNPDQTPLGKEDAAWRSLLANSLDPHGKVQSPFQSITEGWNNPSNQPSYRSIADSILLNGKDIPGLSGVLGLAGGLTNPVNLVGAKIPFLSDSSIVRDLPGHYIPPETVGTMPKVPLEQQPFNVLSRPPQINADLGNLSNVWGRPGDNLNIPNARTAQALQSQIDGLKFGSDYHQDWNKIDELQNQLNAVQPPSLAEQLMNFKPSNTPNEINNLADSILTPNSMSIKQSTAYQKEFNQALQDEFNRLKEIRNNPPGMLDNGGLIRDESPLQGGNILGSFKPTSGNPQWYRDFYAQFGRKPTNNELMSIAKDNLLNGEKDSYFGNNEPWKPQAAQELEDSMNQIQEIMKFEKDPQTLESLGNTLDELAQEHDRIVEQAMNEIHGGTSEATPSIAEQLPKEEPAKTFVMNANAARNEIPKVVEPSDSLPKQPLTNPNYKPGGLFGWWENKLGNPIMDVAGKVGSKIADAPIINKITDTLGKGFVKNFGASSDLVNILKNREAEHTANQANIVDSVGSLAKNNLTNDELSSLGHVIEKTQEGTDNQNSFLPRYQAIKENGVSDSTGTKALLNTALDGKPLLSEDQLLENHFSHMYRNVPKELQGVFPKQGNKTGGLSTKGEFAMPRTFGTLKEAEEAGLKPVTDPLQVLGEYLHQTSKAVTNAKALNDIKSTPGLLFDKATVDNVSKLVKTGRMTADEAARELGMSLDELKRGFVQSSIPQLNKFYIRPADEAAIRNFLDHIDKSTLYDKAMSLWKKGTVFNSLVHMHNILYNGLFLGKAKIGYTFETLKNLATKQPDEWYQRALRAGAISADRGSFLENLKKSIKNVDNPVREKLAYAFHGVLWDMDKSMRTAIFREAVERGATDTRAAARANKFLIDYNNLTPFEEKVMTRIFPFYRWMKGNIPLQAEQWITNTPKQTLAQIINMQLAQAMTGQSPNEEGKWDISNMDPLSNGDHVMIDPYFPGEELGKINAKGVLPYLYGVSNPILKEIASQVMNRSYYPNENLAPSGKEKMGSDKYTIRNEFASPLENTASTIGHTLGQFLPAVNVRGIPIGQLANIGGDSMNNGGSRTLVNDLMGIQQKDKPATTLPEYLIKGLGGFTSRDNPVMDEYYQKTDARDAQQRKNAYNKAHGIPVTPQDRKAAYKKIPFPMGQ